MHRPALFRAGSGKVASPDDLQSWMKDAKPGARCVYAAGPYLPKSLTADMARRFSEQKRAHLTQARIADGFEYVLQVCMNAAAADAEAKAAVTLRAERALLAEIERYMEAVDMPPSVFGLKAVADAKLVWRLRQGLKIAAKELARARAYMADHPAPQAIGASRKAAG